MRLLLLLNKHFHPLHSVYSLQILTLDELLISINSKRPSVSQSSQSIPITSDREMAGFCSENSKLRLFLIAAKGRKANFPQNEFSRSTTSCAHLTAHTCTAGVVQDIKSYYFLTLLDTKAPEASKEPTSSTPSSTHSGTSAHVHSTFHHEQAPLLYASMKTSLTYFACIYTLHCLTGRLMSLTSCTHLAIRTVHICWWMLTSMTGVNHSLELIMEKKKRKFLGGSRGMPPNPPPPPPPTTLKVETTIRAIRGILEANLKKHSTLKFKTNISFVPSICTHRSIILIFIESMLVDFFSTEKIFFRDFRFSFLQESSFPRRIPGAGKYRHAQAWMSKSADRQLAPYAQELHTVLQQCKDL